MSSSRVAVLLGLLLLLSSSGPSLAATTERVSVSGVGEQGNAVSHLGAISGDGRFVAFESSASNLVSGDTNGGWDVFVHDRTTDATERVSVTSAGLQANGDTSFVDVAISGDGRFVAFVSGASNLVLGDTNDTWDAFVHDRATGATERVSVSSTGEQGNQYSGEAVAISEDGRFVAFKSYAYNLVPGDADNTWVDHVFVHDRVTGATERVSVSSDGEQGNAEPGYDDIAISGDGRFVAFRSSASNLVSGDTNGSEDVFVHDCITGATERVSVRSTGEQGNGDSGEAVAISGEGRFVAFESYASNLVPQDTNEVSDIFVHDRATGTTERVNVSSEGEQANSLSGYHKIAISPDGRFVAFDSFASNLVAGDTNTGWDVFVHDQATGATERVSVDSDGEETDGRPSFVAGANKDGRFIVFNSAASNLVPGDTNDVHDVYVRDRGWVGFPDVLPGFWAYDQIEACYDSNIVKGYSDWQYHPADPVTREQMAVYIARAEGWINIDDRMDTAPELFPDVPAGFWAGTAIQACVDNNVVTGYPYPDPDNPGETFYVYAPSETVTRDQMAVFIARSICYPTGDEGLLGYIPADPRNFPDVPATGYGDSGTDPYWAYRYIEYCVEHGVVQGYEYPDPDTPGETIYLYQPLAPVTRDLMAVFIARAFGLL